MSGSFEMLAPFMEQFLSEGKSVSFVPDGVSMLPLIKPVKSTVFIVKPDKISKNDIVLFRRKSGELILHRVIYCQNGGLTVCGDNQFICEKVSSEQIIGVMAKFTTGDKVNTLDSVRYKLYCNMLPVRRARKKAVCKLKCAIAKLIGYKPK